MVRGEQRTGVQCAQCGSGMTRVTDTRRRDGWVLRTRVCVRCGTSFLTEERHQVVESRDVDSDK